MILKINYFNLRSDNNLCFQFKYKFGFQIVEREALDFNL